MNYVFGGILILSAVGFISFLYYIHMKAVRTYFRALTKQKRQSELPPHIAFMVILHPFAILMPQIMLDLKKGNCSEIQKEINEIKSYRTLLVSVFATVIMLGPLVIVLVLILEKKV